MVTESIIRAEPGPADVSIDHERELRGPLARVRRRWFALTVLRAVARAAVWAAAPLATAVLVVRAADPSGWTLVVLAGAAVLCAIALTAAALIRMPRRPDDSHVARFVEERTGNDVVAAGVCDTLVSAVEVIDSPERHAGGFAQLLVRQAASVLRGIDPSSVIPVAMLRRAAARAVAALALFAIAAALARPAALGAAATVWLAAFPHSIGIQVLTGDARVRAGQPLRIGASLSGRGARLLSLTPTLVVIANGEQRSVPMSGSHGSFAYALESVDRSFTYRVIAGGAASDVFSVTALMPPRLQSIEVAYEYPRFTGLAPRRDHDTGDVYAPAGTRIRIDVRADKPLAAGELRLGGAVPVALTTAGQSASAAMVLEKDDAYRIVLSDRDGLSSVGDTEYFIRVMDDRPPSVHIVRPSADQGITPLEEVAIEARADDDYGIAQFELVYAVGGRPAKTMAFTRLAGTDAARIGSHLLAAEDLAVQPGDVISYYARARDVARGKRSSEARSDMFFLEVKPFNEEFVQVQSQSMGGGPQSTQIDTLIAAQKEIINATWNLERRSGAGRSPDDVKAVGEAQAELKRRAERMAAAGRRGGRGFFPQQLLPPQPRGRAEGGDAVGAAVAAMGRAIEQLQAIRTTDALPHQMAALQELLRAQAEVRRRQVMQQSASAGGGGGSSRSDRDLSALFDRELQRQQRTNYEAPKQSGDTPANTDADLLERIRSLARRQEELARRQRELAASKLDAEEMKRQLERLSREQEELRREAERMQQGQRDGSGRAGRGGGGEQADAMQRAAEQMRNASREMQRQNAGTAAASGGQAAEALKRIEQQMRGATAGARQRTAGDMQLEAQQIADGQRRLASEVARLGKETGGGTAASADRARRLAAEKDQLADRVEALERAARDAGRSAPGQEGERFRDAAAQLQGQQIGSRMRKSAQELREARASAASTRPGSAAPDQKTPGASGSAGEQQLTRALDSVASTFGGGAQGDQRKLADQLQRTGEIRERLNGIEQQVRDAEARAQPQAGSRAGRSAQGGGDLQRLRDEYARELQRARDSLGRMQAEQRGGGSTPEQHEFSRSSPGNEAFKQDFGKWEALRKDVDLALEQYEATASARLGRARPDDRLNGGGSERVPEPYRPAVSRYFEAIARAKK